MIIGEKKPIEDILKMIEGKKKVILAGCGGCVTVCCAGGTNEVGVLAPALKIARQKAGDELEIKEVTLERQCDPEYLDPMEEYIGDYEAVLTLACGAGVQFVAERFKNTPVYPALNSSFVGVTEKIGYWTERCQLCGDCKLHLTGGICPIARCSKSLLNGPCGGSMKGKCEIDKDVDCGWQLIYDRLHNIGEEEKLDIVIPIVDWTTSRDGGPRKIVREDLLEKEVE